MGVWFWLWSRRLFSRGTEMWTGEMEKSCLLPNKKSWGKSEERMRMRFRGLAAQIDTTSGRGKGRKLKHYLRSTARFSLTPYHPPITTPSGCST